MRLRLVTLAIVLAIAVVGVMAWQRNTQRATPEATGGTGTATEPEQMPTVDMSTPPTEDPGIEWETPKRWVTELAHGMRLASYIIPAPGEQGETAQCAVYYFGPGQGGGVEANVERWMGEFQNPGKPVRRTREIHGLKVSQVEVTGNYAAHAGAPGEGGGVQSGWSLLGAIVEGPSGAVFFKLTGPSPTVAAAAGEFDGLLRSLRKK